MPKAVGQRERLAKIAAETISAVENGSYMLGLSTYRLGPSLSMLKSRTEFLSESSSLADWKLPTVSTTSPHSHTSIAISEVSTLVALRNMCRDPSAVVGALNFASAKHPGGGFLTGAQAQEESLARSSTLYWSLTCPTGAQFYAAHKEPGFYSHAMLWSPDVLFFRSDEGGWLPPVSVGVVTSPAVNAGAVKHRLGDDSHEIDAKIEACMHERMARILALFESRACTHIVLGSFGTGVFKNDIGTIASLWARLLGPNARFEKTFQHVEFAILGRETFDIFKASFERRCGQLWARLPDD